MKNYSLLLAGFLLLSSQLFAKYPPAVLPMADQDSGLYVPDIFSPNGDGENDVLVIYADTGDVKNIKSFQVYSRWGELVWERHNFQPNIPEFGWDGERPDFEIAPVGMYHWRAIVELAGKPAVLLQGNVTLAR